MKLPSRIQIALGTLIAGGVGLTTTLPLSNPVHKLILLVAGVVLFLLNPEATSPEEALDLYPPAGANQKASATTTSPSQPV
jgi:hypothetical protein